MAAACDEPAKVYFSLLFRSLILAVPGESQDYVLPSRGLWQRMAEPEAEEVEPSGRSEG